MRRNGWRSYQQIGPEPGAATGAPPLATREVQPR
jgi:hypothetical protein